MTSDHRGVAPVTAIVLLVAVAVVLAGGVSAFSLGFTSNLRAPGPNVAQSSGAFMPQSGTAGGIVQITHLGGEPVPVSEIELAVTAECQSGTERGRIQNLPPGSGNDIDASDGQISGTNIFDERSLNSISGEVDGVDNGGALLENEEVTAGETILFRIPASKCTLTDGSTVSVRVVHTPSQSVVIKQELTA